LLAASTNSAQAPKKQKSQGCEEPQRRLFASPKFGRVISESSSELPDLTKANLQIQPMSFFKALGASMERSLFPISTFDIP
jgi:hypothetical protein